jgi:preprotein translocase subunit SecE
MARNVGASGRINPDAARRAFSFKVVGETIAELKRVTWPSRQETTRLTIMVIAVAATVGAFLGLVDIAFARLFDVILGN